MAVEPTRQETVTTNIPDWAQEYATKLLGRASALTEPIFDEETGLFRPRYTPYGGQLVAGLNPMQEQAMRDIAGMGVSPEIDQAVGFTGLAALQAQDLAKYDPIAAQQYFQSPEMGQVDLDFERVAAPERTDYRMAAPERVSAEKFGAEQMREYMSPYMEGVVERQKQGAIQDYLKQLPGMGAAAARAGARGGTREALLESEARKGLSQRLGDIEAQGLQQAYQQAAGQFGADRAAQMQAALANQATGMTASQQDLQAQIQQAQFAAQQALQAGNTNQAAQLQKQAQDLQQQQSLNQLAMQGAGLGAQYGLAGAQLGEQSRQFGAGLGMQGLQQQLAAAGQLGQLGQQRYQQKAGISQAQLGAGAQARDVEQQKLSTLYQQFMDEQQAPYRQLGFMSDILRGTPTSAYTTTMYQQSPSTLGQIGGIAGGLGTLFGNLG
jgi:hypothetical protein